MLDVPVFLYTLMYIVFASAIPLLIMLYLIRVLTKSGKKLFNSFNE
jgi:hypothetical protein